MNIRTPLACTLLLCACSESAKNEFKEEFTQSFRTEFVRSATEACVEKAAGKSPFDSATTEKICAASEKKQSTKSILKKRPRFWAAATP